MQYWQRRVITSLFIFRALNERKKEQQEVEAKTREEVLAKRRQKQQEATKKFQKDTIHNLTRSPHGQNGNPVVTQHGKGKLEDTLHLSSC